MKKYGVVGKNINYSMSPKIFKYLFKRFNIDANYEIINIENITQVIPMFRQFSGLNITVPFKTEVLKYVTDVDSICNRINACNTLVIDNGNITAYNTDSIGFYQAYKQELREDSKIILIGAGGAAKAIYHQLKYKNLDVTVTNRTISNIDFTNNFISLEKASKQLEKFDIIINATNFSDTNNIPINISKLKESAVIIDVVYSPRITKLIEYGINKNLTTFNGLRMLVFQAIKAFELWFDNKYKVTEEDINNILKIINNSEV